jgi:hypothetical protein
MRGERYMECVHPVDVKAIAMVSFIATYYLVSNEHPHRVDSRPYSKQYLDLLCG